VAFRAKSSGFDRWDFSHNALPELNLSDIDPSTVFLGKKIALPFIISSMTGGYAKAEQINQQLAEVCVQKKIALGVGSQRQALENIRYHRSFSVARATDQTFQSLEILAHQKLPICGMCRQSHG